MYVFSRLEFTFCSNLEPLPYRLSHDLTARNALVPFTVFLCPSIFFSWQLARSGRSDKIMADLLGIVFLPQEVSVPSCLSVTALSMTLSWVD